MEGMDPEKTVSTFVMATPHMNSDNGSVASVCRAQLNGPDADIASGQFMAPLRKWLASTRLPKGAKLTPIKAVGRSTRKLEASRVSL